MVEIIDSISALLKAVPDSVYGAIIGLSGTLIGSFVAEHRSRKAQFVQMLTSTYSDLLAAYAEWVQNRTVENMIKFETAAHRAALVASKAIYAEIINLESQITSDRPSPEICNAAITRITLLARAEIRKYLRPIAHNSDDKVGRRNQKQDGGADHDSTANKFG